MSAETNSNSIKDHMARLRLKMVQQKIANEKDRLLNRPGTEESTSNDLENQARLQQAMLRRQELLDKIRREQLMNEDSKRPRSYSERRRYTPSPLPLPPPSRRSLPDFNRYNYYNTGHDDTNRSHKPDMSQVKHVIEHKISSPTPKPRLPPIHHPSPRFIQPPPAPGVIIQPPPPPQIMHQPAPQIIQAPPQQVIQQIPHPVIQNLTGQPQESKSMFNKADFGELQMMQNAELHQLVMMQTMLKGMGMGGQGGLGLNQKPSSAKHRRRNHSSCSSKGHGHHGHHGYCGPPPMPPAPPPPCPPPCPPPQPYSPYVSRPLGTGAVHHHHYTSPPPSQPPVHHYQTMPAMEMRGGYPMRGYASAHTERKPLYNPPPPQRQQSPMPVHPTPPPQRPNVIPVPVLMKRPPVEVPRVIKPPKKSVTSKKKRTLSGQRALSRFRYIAYAVAFTELLKSSVRKNLNNRPSSMFLFGIILKEIVAALHRIYLNPSGNIYPVLNDIIGPNCYDLSALVHGGRLGEREEAVLVQELQYVIENLIYHITEIMPSSGVLGTHRKSAVFELIRSGKRFPDGYFWQVEMERLQFSEQGRTHNIGDSESFLLLTGIFISRSLITTLLMKPVDYGLSTQPLTDMGERNLRMVASTLLYLARRIAISRAQGVMPMPEEIARYLYDDNEMQHIYSRLSRTFNYCEGLLREWGTEYIRRLRASAMQQ